MNAHDNQKQTAEQGGDGGEAHQGVLKHGAVHCSCGWGGPGGQGVGWHQHAAHVRRVTCDHNEGFSEPSKTVYTACLKGCGKSIDVPVSPTPSGEQATVFVQAGGGCGKMLSLPCLRSAGHTGSCQPSGEQVDGERDFREKVRSLLLAIKHGGALSDSPELYEQYGKEFNAVNADMRAYDLRQSSSVGAGTIPIELLVGVIQRTRLYPSHVAVRTILEDELKSIHTHTTKDVQDVVDCLHELAAQVRGECPRLLDEDSGGDARLDLRIDAALAPFDGKEVGR